MTLMSGFVALNCRQRPWIAAAKDWKDSVSLGHRTAPSDFRASTKQAASRSRSLTMRSKKTS